MLYGDTELVMHSNKKSFDQTTKPKPKNKGRLNNLRNQHFLNTTQEQVNFPVSPERVSTTYIEGDSKGSKLKIQDLNVSQILSNPRNIFSQERN